MKIAICTDAWVPQVNGVVTTLTHTAEHLRRQGHEVRVVAPDHEGMRTIPLPGYPEIRLAWRPRSRVNELLDGFGPDCIHIATEGPMGQAGRGWCLAHNRPFTTSYHTRFPEYLRARLPVPEGVSYAWLRRFHAPAEAVLVPTPSVCSALAERGFGRLQLWSRGVDTERFHPDQRMDLGLPGPVWVYAGRLSVEKNLPAFLRLNLPGTKLVIGDGPARAGLVRQFPDVVFVGYRRGEELARYLASGDVFVFPSRTDTFGLVMLEAMASGLPVAAFPVTGPLDVVRPGLTGVLDHDLRSAALCALRLDRSAVRQAALGFGWDACTRQFEALLQPA